MAKYIDMAEFRNNLEVDRFGMTDVRKVNEALERSFVSLREQVESKWISVKERLPEPFVSVLVYVPGDRPFQTVHEGHVAKDGCWYAHFFNREQDEVTHWMPLPEPPKEE